MHSKPKPSLNGSTASKSASTTSSGPDPLDRAQRAIEDGRAATRELAGYDDFDEPTGRHEVNVTVNMKSSPEIQLPEPGTKPDASVAGVARAAVDKLPPSHLLIVVLFAVLAGALVAGRKLGVW